MEEVVGKYVGRIACDWVEKEVVDVFVRLLENRW